MTRERFPTGVSGLDQISGGGLVPGAIYLVVGGPGAGHRLWQYAIEDGGLRILRPFAGGDRGLMTGAPTEG